MWDGFYREEPSRCSEADVLVEFVGVVNQVVITFCCRVHIEKVVAAELRWFNNDLQRFTFRHNVLPLPHSLHLKFLLLKW